MSTRKSSQKKTKLEVWLKIECANPSCITGVNKRNWFWIPGASIPETVRCNLCGEQMKTKGLHKYDRRIKPEEDILEN